MTSPVCLTLTLVCTAMLVAGCDSATPERTTISSAGEVSAAPEGMRPEAWSAVAPSEGPVDGPIDSQIAGQGSGSGSGSVDDAAQTPSAVLGATDIPYPVYPNGSKYRVGGENGLKIVVYQTDDDFEQVDAYYRDATNPSAMPRLQAMQDFVRYSRVVTDDDPWATYRPGIVIHEFSDNGERRAVGARATARTNIILSF